LLPGTSIEFGRRLVDDRKVSEIGAVLGLTKRARSRKAAA
jgi:hypothetical protein